MAVRWKIPFVSLTDKSYSVDIYDNNYSDEPTTLIGGSSPFITNEDDNNDYYTPIRTQSGYIRFIVTNQSIVYDMMPVASTDRPVVLRQGGTIRWMGFLKCEQYSQDWDRTPYEIEMPVISVMLAMQGVMFTQDEGYTSLRSLINTIASYCPVNGIGITVPVGIPSTSLLVNNNNFRDFLTVSERAERDTNNIYASESLYNCVEAFCQYFGVSLHEYEDRMYFCSHENVSYEDVAPDGSTQQTQDGQIPLNSLTICTDNNRLDYSKPYHTVSGRFGTGKSKMESLYNMGEFLKEFSQNSVYPASTETYLLFNGNIETLPYYNGAQSVGPLLISAPGYTGGQIVRTTQINTIDISKRGNYYNDSFFILSSKSKVGSPEIAMQIIIAKRLYINKDERVLLNFKGSIGYTGNELAGNKLYCKLKVGNYWLNYSQSAWTTSETVSWLPIANGKIEGASPMPYYVANKLEEFDGIAIALPPETFAEGYYEVQFTLMANAQQDTSEFGVYTTIDHLLSSFEIKVLRGTIDFQNTSPSFDENQIIRTTQGNHSDTYDVDCNITTRQGCQYGTGLALNSDLSYVTTRHEVSGMERRKRMYARSREIIEVGVRENDQPINGITYNSKTYAVISQSIDWRNDTNMLKIIDSTN